MEAIQKDILEEDLIEEPITMPQIEMLEQLCGRIVAANQVATATPICDKHEWDTVDGYGQVPVEIARELEIEGRKLRQCLTDLMPFVLEDYYPNCATAPYKAAVENAKAILKPNVRVQGMDADR